MNRREIPPQLWPRFSRGLCLGLGLAVAGCSGAPNPQIIPKVEAGNATVDGAAPAPAVDTGGATKPPATGADATVSVADAAMPESAASVDASIAVESGVAEAAPRADAARDAGDAGVSTEAGTADAASPTFVCGTTSCVFAAETCCVQGGGFAMMSTTCVAGTMCPGNGAVALHCAASADCPAPDVCCLSAQPGPAVSECRVRCAPGQSELCDPAAVTTTCPMRCTTPMGGGMARLPPNVGVCQ